MFKKPDKDRHDGTVCAICPETGDVLVEARTMKELTTKCAEQGIEKYAPHIFTYREPIDDD